MNYNTKYGTHTTPHTQMPWIDAVVGTQAVRFADCTIGGMARICTKSRSTARKVIGSRTCSIRYESAFLCVSVWLTASLCACADVWYLFVAVASIENRHWQMSYFVHFFLSIFSFTFVLLDLLIASFTYTLQLFCWN